MMMEAFNDLKSSYSDKSKNKINIVIEMKYLYCLNNIQNENKTYESTSL